MTCEAGRIFGIADQLVRGVQEAFRIVRTDDNPGLIPRHDPRREIVGGHRKQKRATRAQIRENFRGDGEGSGLTLDDRNQNVGRTHDVGNIIKRLEIEKPQVRERQITLSSVQVISSHSLGNDDHNDVGNLAKAACEFDQKLRIMFEAERAAVEKNPFATQPLLAAPRISLGPRRQIFQRSPVFNDVPLAPGAPARRAVFVAELRSDKH